MKIPSLILKQLYTFGSLGATPEGVQSAVKNRLSDATLTGIGKVVIDGTEVPLDRVVVAVGEDQLIDPKTITPEAPIQFPLAKGLTIQCHGVTLDKGRHEIKITFEAEPFGVLDLKVKDSLKDPEKKVVKIPYDKEHNFEPEIIKRRQQFIETFTGAKLHHISRYSFDPHVTQGNIENFTGVAQVPIGFAGPLKINGEHANGEFVIPLATTEGTLVASYNRGMKVLNLSGGVTTTVVDDKMQRAPVFIFDSAREARDFRQWVLDHMDEIRERAEATSSVAKLEYIDIYLASRFAYLRFNFQTGDAAGQNMVGRATFAACSWILEQAPNVKRFFLESNLATDKKASQINLMRTRGKRVIAEVTIPRDVLIENMRVEPESLTYHFNVANVGSILSGANNNGLHSPNGITAMFIATGQDVANVSEGSAGILHTELTPEKDLYISITIPSLIVATYGGGTGLPTQRECLELLGCWGKGKVKKLAEIVAGVVLAGEISLASAISSLDWVSSHEQYGRNR